MPGLLPAAVYGLKVPCGDHIVQANDDPSPVSFRITMAALDPTAAPEFSENTSGDAPVRATLKLIREPINSDMDDDSEDDDEDYLGNMLNGDSYDDDEEDKSSDDDEKNGGPSDPEKSKKARRVAKIEQLKEALAQEDSDEDMGVGGSNKPNNGLAKTDKGKGRLVNGDAMSDDSSDVADDYEEFVLCTLDPEKHYQQPLDITVGEHEQVFFKVSGTHAIYLTGNYVIPIDDAHRHGDSDSEDDEDEDFDVDADGLYDDEESDELDDIEDPRITELGSEDEADVIPKLVKAEPESKKGKNKRAAEDAEPAGLDDIMAKSLKPEVPATNGEQKLSKKQLKKLKNNAGKAVDATTPPTNGVKADEKAVQDAKAEGAEAKDKKVKFAKNLEQGPSGTTATSATENEKKADVKKDAEKLKATLGVKMVQGVKIDDKKLGSGPACKKGNKVSMRYIGKLENGQQFDHNKKGKPFTFTLGIGEVIKGWEIGITGMSIGGERRITIPSSLGYGKKPQPGIPANSTLIFEVKLLEIK